MLPAALRFFLLGVFGLAAVECASAADTPVRAVPSRPAVPAPVAPPKFSTIKISSIEYVPVSDVAAWLGGKASWTEAGRKLALTDKAVAGRKLELESNSRLVVLDGLRIYLGIPTVLRRGQLYVSRIDAERCLAPLLRPAAIANPPAAPKIIALDAGHGGEDPGMQNEKLGLKEKVLTLDVVMRAKKLLEAAGYKVVLTRTDDRAVAADKRSDLFQRAELANRAHADLFVSVHFNSLFPDTKTSGTEVFVYTPQHQRSSKAWGLGQDDDTKHEAFPVNRYDAWSTLLAHHLHREVIDELKTFDRGHKTMHLLALQDLNCPAALVESVFLSNEAEARRAATPEYRQKIAQGIVDGVSGYANAIERLRPPAASVQAGRAKSAVASD